jgi:RNA polymerase sigma factor for flagellar operon FliA
VVDEDTLWKNYKKTGNPEIRDELIVRYAPLVKYIAGRVAVNLPPTVDFDDLVSYGILGLIDAIEKFDIKQGSKFKTYASSRIKGAIFDELRLLDWVPRSIRQKGRELEEVYSRLEHKYGRPATDEEVANALGITVQELEKMILKVSGAALTSLDEMWSVGEDDDEVAVGDTIEGSYAKSPDLAIEKEEVKRILVDAINRLPQREKEVVALYYYEELTLKEIGEVLGVTESRVSQLHTKAILRLRGSLSRIKNLLKGSLV